MNPILQMVLFIFIIFVCFTVQGITGFGASVMAVPFLSLFMDIKEVVVIVCIISLMMSIIVAIRSHNDINWKELIKIAVLILVGAPLGMYLAKTFDSRVLEIIYGVMILLIAFTNLYSIYLKKESEKAPNQTFKEMVGVASLFTAGIVHGAFASGGPLAAVYVTDKFKSKEVMRSTLCATWVGTNLALTIANGFAGKLTSSVLTYSFASLPAVIGTIFLGAFIAKKISLKVFVTIVYLVLIVAGALMIV